MNQFVKDVTADVRTPTTGLMPSADAMAGRVAASKVLDAALIGSGLVSPSFA